MKDIIDLLCSCFEREAHEQLRIRIPALMRNFHTDFIYDLSKKEEKFKSTKMKPFNSFKIVGAFILERTFYNGHENSSIIHMFGTLPEYSSSKYMSSLLHDIFLPESMREKIVYVLITFGTHRFVTEAIPITVIFSSNISEVQILLCSSNIRYYSSKVVVL